MEVESYNDQHDLKERYIDWEHVPETDGGQPLSLEEEEDLGTKLWEHIQKDKYVYDYQPKFPGDSDARTSFHARGAQESEKLYERLWKYQHGRGHTFEGWENRSRQEDRDDFHRANAILSQLEVSDHVRDAARERVMRENLNGFSRYYQGLDGACVGFALLYRYDTVDQAKESHILERACKVINVDEEKLVEYVWRKYGGDSR